MESAEESLMSSSGEFVKEFNKVMVCWFRDVESMFEV